MKLLAKLGDQQLFVEDISHKLLDASNQADSNVIIDAEIEGWLRSAAFKFEANNQLKPNSNIELQVSRYRDDLVMHAYEIKLLESQNLTVTEAEIQDYFTKNRSLFPKATPLVSFEWVKAKPDAKGITAFFESWQARKNIDFDKICSQKNVECWISSEKYQALPILASKIPTKWYSETDFKKKKRKQKNIGGYEYFLNIVDYKVGDENSVLEQSKELIKTLCLNQKKEQFLQNHKESLYQETLKKNLIKKYIDK